jgi:phospho-N-acetylmuramoyl-pentapeptide-transferase
VIRLLVAATLAVFVSLVGTRYLVSWLTRHRIGQPIHEDVPEGHVVKAGTPTMGGVAIVVGAVLGYLVSRLYNVFSSDGDTAAVFTRTGLSVMGAIAGAGLVGFLDDWLKVSRERNLGLNKRMKSLGLLTVATTFALVIAYHTPTHRTLSFARFDKPGVELGVIPFVIFAVLVIIGTTNAVNLTDGLDGLAAGCGILAFMAFTVMSFWMFGNPDDYDISHALDLAIVGAAMAGSCIGFLWWNAAPARIFMGDTGSLAIGAGLAGLALTTSTVLLLPIIGAIFVMETVSVILQVARFRTTGKRFFKMAPIHHHFELSGWPETTVIIRFWIISGIFTALALGLFYADFLSAADLLPREGATE